MTSKGHAALLTEATAFLSTADCAAAAALRTTRRPSPPRRSATSLGRWLVATPQSRSACASDHASHLRRPRRCRLAKYRPPRASSCLLARPVRLASSPLPSTLPSYAPGSSLSPPASAPMRQQKRAPRYRSIPQLAAPGSLRRVRLRPAPFEQ